MEPRYINNLNGGITIPHRNLNQIIEIPLGYQPLGISTTSTPDCRTMFALCDYFSPAICLGEVVTNKEGLHINPTRWIGMAFQGEERFRLYPGKPNERAQTVSVGPNGEVWTTANGGRTIFVLSNQANPANYDLIREITLPGEGMVHSMDLTFGTASVEIHVKTVESSHDLTKWWVREYILSTEGTVNSYDVTGQPIPPFTYGITVQDITRQVGNPYTRHTLLISDPRSPTPSGIFSLESGKNFIPNITGNGICFIRPYGGTLVTSYGQANEQMRLQKGTPGKLTYIPRGYFHGVAPTTTRRHRFTPVSVKGAFGGRNHATLEWVPSAQQWISIFGV